MRSDKKGLVVLEEMVYGCTIDLRRVKKMYSRWSVCSTEEKTGELGKGKPIESRGVGFPETQRKQATWVQENTEQVLDFLILDLCVCDKHIQC